MSKERIAIKFIPLMRLINESEKNVHNNKIQISLCEDSRIPSYSTTFTTKKWEELLEDKEMRNEFAKGYYLKNGLDVLFKPSLKVLEDERISSLVEMEEKLRDKIVDNKKILGGMRKELTETRESLTQEYQSKLKVVDSLINDLNEFRKKEQI